MDPHLSSVAELAWCRELGVGYEALTARGRVTTVDDAAPTLRVLTVGDLTVVAGPGHAVDAVDACDAHLDEQQLRAVTGGYAARTEILSLGSDWLDASRVRDPLISHDPADLAELTRRCPPDDVTAAALPVAAGHRGDDGPERIFVLLDDDHHPLSAAGHHEIGTLVADVRALTTPEHRRLGFAATVATLCTHEALDAGLVPLWRARRDDFAARGLGAVLGYEQWGTLMTLRVPAPR